MKSFSIATTKGELHAVLNSLLIKEQRDNARKEQGEAIRQYPDDFVSAREAETGPNNYYLAH